MTNPIAVAHSYAHRCADCGGRTYTPKVVGHRELRVRVRHAIGCALLAEYMERWPMLYGMRKPEALEAQ